MMFIGNNPRAQTEIKGITFEQLYHILQKRFWHLDETDDPDAMCQQLCCEVEKKMGIYPNVPGLEKETD